MRKQLFSIIVSCFMIISLFPSVGYAANDDHDMAALEEEVITEDEALEYYGVEGPIMADNYSDSDGEGEEVIIEDQGIDIEGEEEELGTVDDEDIEEVPEMEITLPQESSSDLGDEEFYDDEEEEDDQSIDGYDELDIPEDEGGNENPENEEEVQDELAIGDNDISTVSEFFVGNSKTDKLTVNFRKKATKLYVKVQNEKVCSCDRGPISGKKAIIYIRGLKAGASTKLTIKTKFAGLVTLKKKTVRVRVVNVKTTPSKTLNVVKGGMQKITCTADNAPRSSTRNVKVMPSYGSKIRSICNVSWSKSKAGILLIKGKKAGSGTIDLRFYDSRYKTKTYATKRITVNVRAQPSVGASTKNKNLLVNESTTIPISWGNIYGENCRLVPASTNTSAVSVSASKTSANTGLLTLTGKKKGKATISLYLISKNTGESIAKKVNITVNVSQPGLSLSAGSITMETGGSTTILCTSSGMSGSYSFYTAPISGRSNISVSSEKRSGNKQTLRIRGLNAGTAKINIYLKKGSKYYSGKTISVTVKPKAKPSISLSKSSVNIGCGDSANITATLRNMPTGQLYCSVDKTSGASLFSFSKTDSRSPVITIKAGKNTGSGSIRVNIHNNGRIIASSSASIQVTTQSRINTVSYSFNNITGSASKNVCKYMFRNQDWNAVYETYNGAIGNCFGMSTTAGMLRAGYVYPSSFNSSAVYAKHLGTGNKNSRMGLTVKEWIQAMQIASLSYGRFYNIGGSEYNHYGCSINEMVNAVKNGVSSGRYTVIEFLGKRTNDGHAVLGIGFEKVNSSQDRILLYDNTNALETKYLTLYKNSVGNYTGFHYKGRYYTYNESKYDLAYDTYSGYTKLWSNRGSLRYVNNRAVNSSENDAGIENEESCEMPEDMNMVSVSSDNFTITDVDDNVIATVENGIITSCTDSRIKVALYPLEDVDNDTDENEDSNQKTFIYLPVRVYQFTNNDLNTERFSVVCANIELSTSVETTGDCIAVCADDRSDLATAILNTVDGEEYSVSLGSSREGDPEEMTWTGLGTGEDISIAMENGTLSMCNAESASLSISEDEDNKTQAFTISSVAGEGGQISPEGDVPVWGGEEQEFIFEADSGYEISDVEVDGKSVGRVNRYVFRDVQECHSIYVKFTKGNYDTCEDGHTWGATTYKWNGTKTVTATSVCETNAAHKRSETVNTTAKVTRKPTYTAMGQTTYTATFANSAFETQKKTLTNIPKLPQNKVSAPTGKATILNTIANSSKKTNDAIWDKSKVKGANKYELNWKSRTSKKWASATVGNVTRGKTTGLSIGGLYDIRVRPVAVSAGGKKANGSWSPTVHRYFHTTGGIDLKSNSKGSFTMKWRKNSAATGYQVMFTTNKNGSGAANNINTVGSSATSFTKKGLRSGTTYYVQIREIKKAGGITYVGNISKPVAVKVK